MACATLTGVTLDCLEGVGGVKKVAFAPFSTTATFAVDSAGQVTGVTSLTPSGVVFECEDETANMTETTTTNIQNGSIYEAGAGTVVLNNMTQTKRNAVEALKKNRTFMVVKDENSRYWLCGKTRGVRVTGGPSGTGTALGDRNGYEVALTWNEPAKALEMTAAAAAQFAAF